MTEFLDALIKLSDHFGLGTAILIMLVLLLSYIIYKLNQKLTIQAQKIDDLKDCVYQLAIISSSAMEVLDNVKTKKARDKREELYDKINLVLDMVKKL